MKLSSFQDFFANKDAVEYFRLKYEDVSEPLMEYEVSLNGSLTLKRAPWLLGVQKNGRWGWIDTDERFVIPPIYDYGYALCYDSVVILEKGGKYGALYTSDFTKEAFSFRYAYISRENYDTFIVHNSLGLCALAKTGDCLITGYYYLGFLKKQVAPHLLTYARYGLFGVKLMGEIDLRNGKEVSKRIVSEFPK